GASQRPRRPRSRTSKARGGGLALTTIAANRHALIVPVSRYVYPRGCKHARGSDVELRPAVPRSSVEDAPLSLRQVADFVGWRLIEVAQRAGWQERLAAAVHALAR